MAAIALKTGKDGVRQRSYHVFLAVNTPGSHYDDIVVQLGAFLRNANNPVEFDDSYTALSAALALMEEVGECRSDSIDIAIEDGNSVDGNTLGKIILSKTGSFSAELINATPDNVNKLSLFDGKDVIIILIEATGSELMFDDLENRFVDHVLATDARNVIILSNFSEIQNQNYSSAGKNLTVNHKVTGGNSILLTLNIEDSCQDASGFRKIQNVPYEIANSADDFVLTEINATTISIELPPTLDDGYIVHCAVNESSTQFFQGAYITKYIPADSLIGATITVPGAGDYILRAATIKNGKIASSFSKVRTV